MNPEGAALLTDNSLTDSARILGVYLAMLGEGWHELRYDELARILHGYPSADTVGRHVRMLVAAGWVERTLGGRGHGDRYRWTGRKFSPHSAPLSINGTEFSPHLQAPPKADSPPLEPPAKDSPPLEQGAKGPSRARIEKAINSLEDEDGEGAGAREVFPLAPKARSALEEYDGKFSGFRGALGDYLQARVPTPRQYGYVRSVATWLDGGDPAVNFKNNQGIRAPPGQIPGIIASALNELLAGDEGTMSRPIGDPGNLKTKISILSKQGGTNGRNTRSGGKGGSADGTAATPARRTKPIPVES